jgi:hypothetical protein
MQQVPAGVAQLAERPSCKRQSVWPLTLWFAQNADSFGMYSARAWLSSVPGLDRCLTQARRGGIVERSAL